MTQQDDAEILVPAIVPRDNEATVNITYSGQNGDLPDPVPYDTSDAEIKRMVIESVRDGYVPGIVAAGNVDLGNFVVDRFGATHEQPHNRIFVRPKTPFDR